MKNFKISLYAAIVAILMTTVNPAAKAGTDPFIGEIMMFAGQYCPRNWIEANGELITISQYQSLFSVIGNQFGGDGKTTMRLPDLRGRLPMGFGQGPDLSNRDLGAKVGQEKSTIAVGGAEIKYQEGADETAKSVKIVEGVNTEISNIPPVLVIKFCISLYGNYPPRP